jgi:hypothetical protein
MNARYLLMVQATLLPDTFHTRQVV